MSVAQGEILGRVLNELLQVVRDECAREPCDLCPGVHHALQHCASAVVNAPHSRRSGDMSKRTIIDELRRHERLDAVYANLVHNACVACV